MNNFEIRSLGNGGFDVVYRADNVAAKSAAEVHKRATGNQCNIRQINE